MSKTVNPELRDKTLNSLTKITSLINDSKTGHSSEYSIRQSIKECIKYLNEYDNQLTSNHSPVIQEGIRPSFLRQLSKDKKPVNNSNSNNVDGQELQSKESCSSSIRDRIKLLNTAVQTSSPPTSPKIDSNQKPFWRQNSKAAVAVPEPEKDENKNANSGQPSEASAEPEEDFQATIYIKQGIVEENGQLQIFKPISSKFQAITKIEIQNFEIQPEVFLNSLKNYADTIKSIHLCNVVLIGVFPEKMALPNLEDYKISFSFKEYLPITKSILKNIIFWDTTSATIDFDSLTKLNVNIDIMIRKRIVLRIDKTSGEFIKNYAMVDEDEGDDDDVIYPPDEMSAQEESKLKSLALRNCTISNPLQTIPENLTHLNLYKTEIIQGDFDAILKNMKNLQDLRVTPFIGRLSINMSSLAAEQLTHLSMYNIEIIYSPKNVSIFKKLDTLCLDFCCMNEEIVNRFSHLFPNVKRVCLFDPSNNSSNYLLLSEILQTESLEWIWFDKFKDHSFSNEDFLRSINKILKETGTGLTGEGIVDDCQHWIYFNLAKVPGSDSWEALKKSGPAKVRFDMFGMHKFWKSFEAFQEETVRVMGAIHCCEGTLTC